jgi:hypothetical protein
MALKVHPPARDEAGTSVVGTTFGFAAFLGFLLFAVNIAVGLYARSTATAVVFDQTRRLAEQGVACAGGTDATEAAVVEHLGGWWRRVQVVASCDGDVATVLVDATSSRSLVPAALLRPTRIAELHRSFVVRIEVPR